MRDMPKLTFVRCPLLPWLALITVWIVWGSTYLGIQLAVDAIPPLLMAGLRFLTAGTVMFAIVGPRPAPGARVEAVVVSAVVLIVGGEAVAQRIGRRTPLPNGSTRPSAEPPLSKGSTR